MSTIVTRAAKGSPLTNAEVDSNFTNLNTDKAELSGATFTGDVTSTGFAGDITGAVLFQAKAGEGFTKGDPVYISGISGNQTVVSKADANDANKMPCFGIVDATVSINAACSVVTFGTLSDLNTSAFGEGDELYISDTGTLSATAPTGEASQLQKIAKVTRAHASAGSIKVMGAGRTNATPNLDDGKFFLGNSSNESASATFSTSVTGIALPLSGGAMTGAITTNSTVDGRDVATDGTKLDGIEAAADVTDATNVTASGALMDSELTSIASVKALDQGVATTDSPTFAGATVTGEITANAGIALPDSQKATFGASDDLQIYHTGSDSRILDTGTGNLRIMANNLRMQSALGEQYIIADDGGAVTAYYDNSAKLATTATGIDVTGTATMDNAHVPSSGSYEVGGSASGSTAIGSLSNSAGKLTLDTDSTRSIHFKTGGTLRQTIDGATGNVGIGMTPAKLLDLQATDNLAMRFYNSTSFKAGIEVPTSSGDMITGSAVNDLAIRSQGNMLFAAGGATERMRIDSSGVAVGGKLVLDAGAAGITGIENCDVQVVVNSVAGVGIRRLGNGEALRFVHTSTDVGSIDFTTSATSYNTSSDYRLKEDLQPMVYSIDRLKLLQPWNFAWKADGSRVDGFMAHEAQEVVAECATGTKDAMKDEEYEVTAAVEEVRDADDNITTEAADAVMGTRSVPDMQGIDQSKLVPLLVAALQEAIARIETLEAGE